jgi:hypothetical protein
VLRHTGACRAAHLRDPCPQPARGPQFRDGAELVGGRGEPELQLPCGLLDRQPGAGQRTQVRDGGRQGAAQFLSVGRARFVVRQRVDDH